MGYHRRLVIGVVITHSQLSSSQGLTKLAKRTVRAMPERSENFRIYRTLSCRMGGQSPA